MTTIATDRSVEESAEILDAFQQSVSREAHNLSRWPELTWQLQEEWLGGAITCPTEDCDQRLRVNPHFGQTILQTLLAGRR